MQIIFYVYPKETIQRGVELESSLLAIRVQHNQQANIGSDPEAVFENLVFDAANEALFKRLFEQARAELIQNISSNYLADTPTEMQDFLREYPDFNKARDFALWLNMPDRFPLQYRQSIDVKIEEFLINHILYRWFETKLPSEAQLYALHANKAIDDVKQLLVRSTKPIKRLPSFP